MRDAPFKCFSSALFLLVLGGLTATLAAAAEHPPPLREGTVQSFTDEPLYSYIEAVDGLDRVFYVISSLCRVEVGKTIRVLTGSHYERMRVPALGGIIQDVYLARVLELDGKRVTGFVGESMVPQGCTILD